MPDIMYASMGGPPDNWRELIILRDGYELQWVTEASAEEGWAIVLSAMRLVSS